MPLAWVRNIFIDHAADVRMLCVFRLWMLAFFVSFVLKYVVICLLCVMCERGREMRECVPYGNRISCLVLVYYIMRSCFRESVYVRFCTSLLKKFLSIIGNWGRCLNFIWLYLLCWRPNKHYRSHEQAVIKNRVKIVVREEESSCIMT